MFAIAVAHCGERDVSIEADAGPVWPSSGDVVVDWTTSPRDLASFAVGFNCAGCFDPSFTRDPAFVSALQTLTQGRGLIRLHGWGMVTPGSGQCWLAADGTWDAAKVHDALAPLVAAGLAPQLLIDIPSGPAGNGDVLDANAFASFASSLVDIVNVQNGFAVPRWELPNEQEGVLDANQMATLMRTSSRAMKALDPGIAVGGPALSWIDGSYLVTLLSSAGADIDFVSAHTYGGDGSESEAAAYASAASACASAHDARVSIDAAVTDRHVPLLIDEYNFGWNFVSPEYDHRGAVYDAIVALGVLTAGADATAHWSGMTPGHDMALVDSSYVPRDSGRMLTTLANYVRGRMIATTVVDASTLLAFASADGATRTLVVANLGGAPRTVTLSFAGWTTPSFSMWSIDDSGFHGPVSIVASNVAANGLSVAAEAVVVLVGD